MEKCIYTYSPLNNLPDDDNAATLEHIVPYALGGCREFGIEYCSKKANNTFGSDIDSPFISHPIVGFKRHKYGLKGYSGEVPDVIFDGVCKELNTPCKIVFPHQAEPYADFGLAVEGGFNKGLIEYYGSEDRIRIAFKQLLNKAKKTGRTLISSSGTPIISTEDALNHAVVEVGESLHFRLNANADFFSPWSKGIMKIALGLGAFSLGRSWAFSPAADKLRTILLTAPSKEQINSTLLRIPDEIRKLINIQRGKHTLAVLPGAIGDTASNGMTAYISLFGGELYEAIIGLGDGPADVKTVNDALPKNWKCVFTIDPDNRSLTQTTIGEINCRLDIIEQ